MLVVNVGRRCLVWQQKSDQIHQANLRLVFSYFKHLDELVNSLLRDGSKVKDFQPLLEVFNLSNFVLDCIRVSKLLYNFFHFINISLGIERLRGQVSWLELLEWYLIMLARFDKLTFWHLFCQLSNRGEERWFICSLKVLELLSVEKSNEIWDSIHLESLSSILRILSVDCCEYQVLIVI